MSEYQYYEFQAIERALTAKEQGEIKELSSRAQVTATQAIFEYNYGDFRGTPAQLLTKYFDAMFYIANWGTWQLMFRFPKALVNLDWFQPYLIDDAITITENINHIILDITINQEECIYGWVEGKGWLSRLLPLRDDLLNGDLRLLYLVWLRVAPHLSGYILDDDPIEPPIPPNLSQLSEPLKAFIELVELDSDLVAAASQASIKQQSPSPLPLENWLFALSESEKQAFLLKLVRREPHVDLLLIQRLQELAGTTGNIPQLATGNRRFSELSRIATTITTERQQQERKVAKIKRIKELEALAPKAEATWQRIVELIALKQARTYDEATALLKDLGELAEYQGRLPEFRQRLEQLKSDYSNRPALKQRFQTIKF